MRERGNYFTPVAKIYKIYTADSDASSKSLLSSLTNYEQT